MKKKIPAFIDATKKQLKQSDLINADLWPIGESKPNGDEDMGFDEAVERLKKAFLDKLAWMDSQISDFDI